MDLDDALRSTRREGGRVGALIAERWCINGRAHGGYLAALAERACTAVLARPDATLRTITVHYLRGVAPGVVEFDVTVEHSGRRLASVSYRMRQGDVPTIVGVASFAPAGDTFEFRDLTPPPRYPPVDALTRSLDVPYVPRPFLELLDLRLAPDPPLFSQSATARVGGWVRLAQHRRPDVSTLLVLCDVFPRALMATMSHSPSVPPPTTSLHMLIHESDIAAHVRDDEHLIAELTTRRVNEGFLDEDSTLWSPDGTLLAQGRQLAINIV
ncbi:MAG TPA: thioesterase family protein [Acidimicrobiales bacterium]|nr:thioesterase family protein [Acidimicrobiales bacterium]